MDTLNLLTAVALLILSLDVALQMWKVWYLKSSEDVSILGIGARWIAVNLLLIKFIVVQDTILIWGQALLVVLLTLYFIMLAQLQPRKVKKRKRQQR